MRFLILLSALSHFNLSTVFSEPLTPELTNPYPNEIQNRHHLAEDTLKSQLEKMVIPEIGPWKKYEDLKKDLSPNSPLAKLEKTLSRENSVALLGALPQANSQNAQSFPVVKLAIDLKSDSSSLEYLGDRLEIKVRESRTFNSLARQSDFADNLSLTVNRRWEAPQLKTSFYLPFTSTYYTASISHDIAKGLTSSVMAQSPLRGSDVANKFEIKLAFAF
jgi:hypothetical protein